MVCITHSFQLERGYANICLYFLLFLNIIFRRVARRIYVAIDEDCDNCIAVLEKCGRDLSFLKDEFIPEESANNYDYIYRIKKFAQDCGLIYYAYMPWKKSNFVSNMGRKAKNK